MSLKTSLFKRISLLFLLIQVITINAQQSTEINVYQQGSKRNSVINQLVKEAHNTGIAFQSVKVLNEANFNLSSAALFDTRKAKFYNLEKTGLSQIANQKPEAINLTFELEDHTLIELELIQSHPTSDDFYVETSEGERIETKLGTYYYGIVKNSPESSIAAITFFQDKVLGLVTVDNQNLIFDAIPNAPNSLIIYKESDIANTPEMKCLTDRLDAIEHNPNFGQENAGDCIRVYIECDFALYNNKGSVQATVDWITSVFNNIKTLYTNESINTTLSEVFVWTSADPYSKTDSYTALVQFKNQRPTFNGDLAHLAALGGNNIGGIAWVDALCTSYKYAYSNIYSTYANVPTYSWTIEVMTHEMGHNVGSNHTHWCGWTGGAIDNCYTPEGNCAPGPPPTNGGTIMSYCHLTNYGINFNNGFGPKPGDKLRERVIAAKCLGTSCSGNSCGVPTGLVISNITNTSAKATWNAVSGANSYDFEYKLGTSNTWTVVNVTTTTYTMNALTAGQTYNTRVKAKCTGGNSTYSTQVNFTTTGGSSCGTPTNFAVSNVTSNSATCSWTAVSGANSYNFQYKLATSNTWSQANVTVTTVNLTGLSPNTTYNVRVQAVCGSNTSPFTNTIAFTTLNTSYCTSKGNNATFEWVSRVKIGTIDRISASDGGYYNGTGLVTDVNKGSTYTLNFQAGSTGQSGTLYWKVWIDWNRDNDFLDVGEEVLTKASPSLTLQSASITVPSGASTGTTRMRVSVKYGSYATSCQVYSYGEVEDYTLNVKAAGTLIAGSNVHAIQIQPNPFNEYLDVQLNSEIDQTVKVSVVNLLGEIQYISTQEVLQGANSIHLSLDQLAPSTYILNIEAANQSWQKKIVKQN